MARPREPVNLLLAKGKKHLTKEEIEERRAVEIQAPSDAIAPPDYLTKKQANEFLVLAKQLTDIGIMSNLDCDLLARYIVSKDLYLKLSTEINSIIGIEDLETQESVAKLHDRYFKQCQTCANALGLTISSRCKLIAPTKETDQPKENKFNKFKKG